MMESINPSINWLANKQPSLQVLQKLTFKYISNNLLFFNQKIEKG
jgi:hypothetical protein